MSLAIVGFAAPAQAFTPMPSPSPVPLPTQTPGPTETVTKSVVRNCSITGEGFVDEIPLTFTLTRPAVLERGHTFRLPLTVSTKLDSISASLAVRGAVTVEGSLSGLLFINSPGFSASQVFRAPYGPSPLLPTGPLGGTDELLFTLPAQGTSDGRGSIAQKTTSIAIVARDANGVDVVEGNDIFNTGRFCETSPDLGEELFTFPVEGAAPDTATPTPTPTVTPTPTPGPQYSGTLCVDPAPGAVPRTFEVTGTTSTSFSVFYSLGFGCFPLPMAVTVELDGNVVDRYVGGSFQVSGSYTASGLEPGSTHRIKVTAVLPSPDGGTPSSRVLADRDITTLAVEPTPTPTPLPPTPKPNPIDPTPTPEPTASPSPSPSPVDQVVPYGYTLSGSASLKTLTKGSLPLSGSIAAKLGIPSGKFTGDLVLAPSTGNLTALGFLPVQAKVNLVPTEQVTGTLKSGKLTAVAKVRIKLPSVKTFGIELAGGANCQAKQISSITLASTQPTFLPLSGGPIAGTFSISDLSGCGFLTGIVSPLTSGSGNTIALNLTPAPTTAS